MPFADGSMNGMSEQQSISEYFDELYGDDGRYWWKQEERHAGTAKAFPYSLLTQMTLRLIEGRSPGRALDLGAGEGADAIRLALLGYHVTAVEISKVGADKIRRFAAAAGADIDVEEGDLTVYEPDGKYDLILCNGVLHYIEDKQAVIDRMKAATRPGGINVVSTWSDYTPVPECHRRVPVYLDAEDGAVTRSYSDWDVKLLYFERDKGEHSHDGMPPHSHSHVKLIAVKPG